MQINSLSVVTSITIVTNVYVGVIRDCRFIDIWCIFILNEANVCTGVTIALGNVLFFLSISLEVVAGKMLTILLGEF